MEAEKNAWAVCKRIGLGSGSAKGDLKGRTEALICSAQEQALRTSYTRY